MKAFLQLDLLIKDCAVFCIFSIIFKFRNWHVLFFATAGGAYVSEVILLILE